MSTVQAMVSDRLLYAMGSMVEDERKVSAVIRYINALRDEQAPCQFSENEMREILAQATLDVRAGKGTLHDDFKREMASWLR